VGGSIPHNIAYLLSVYSSVQHISKRWVVPELDQNCMHQGLSHMAIC